MEPLQDDRKATLLKELRTKRFDARNLESVDVLTQMLTQWDEHRTVPDEATVEAVDALTDNLQDGVTDLLLRTRVVALTVLLENVKADAALMTRMSTLHDALVATKAIQASDASNLEGELTDTKQLLAAILTAGAHSATCHAKTTEANFDAWSPSNQVAALVDAKRAADAVVSLRVLAEFDALRCMEKARYKAIAEVFDSERVGQAAGLLARLKECGKAVTATVAHAKNSLDHVSGGAGQEGAHWAGGRVFANAKEATDYAQDTLMKQAYGDAIGGRSEMLLQHLTQYSAIMAAAGEEPQHYSAAQQSLVRAYTTMFEASVVEATAGSVLKSKQMLKNAHKTYAMHLKKVNMTVADIMMSEPNIAEPHLLTVAVKAVS